MDVPSLVRSQNTKKKKKEINKEAQSRWSERFTQSTVLEKMATLHFTRIPGETEANIRHIEIHQCTNKNVYARFEGFRTFLYVFMSVCRVFLR